MDHLHSTSHSYILQSFFSPGTPMSTSKFRQLFGLHDPEFRLVTSPWVTPLALFFIRFTLTVYAIAAGIFDLFYNVLVIGEGRR